MRGAYVCRIVWRLLPALVDRLGHSWRVDKSSTGGVRALSRAEFCCWPVSGWRVCTSLEPLFVVWVLYRVWHVLDLIYIYFECYVRIHGLRGSISYLTERLFCCSPFLFTFLSSLFQVKQIIRFGATVLFFRIFIWASMSEIEFIDFLYYGISLVVRRLYWKRKGYHIVV